MYTGIRITRFPYDLCKHETKYDQKQNNTGMQVC